MHERDLPPPTLYCILITLSLRVTAFEASDELEKVGNRNAVSFNLLIQTILCCFGGA